MNAKKEDKGPDKPAVEAAQNREGEYITIEDFARLDLRVAEVKAAEKMKKQTSFWS